MRIAAIIQARSGGTRFPGKVHKLLGGRPVLDWVVQAAATARAISEVRVAWPSEHEPEEDVLARYARVAAEMGPLDGIVRLTADCPLMDPQVIDLVVGVFRDSGVEYVSNIYPIRSWPDGMDVEVFTPSLLFRAHQRATKPYDREHVTPWMQREGRWRAVQLPVDWSSVRLTLDEPRDLAWLEQCLTSPRS